MFIRISLRVIRINCREKEALVSLCYKKCNFEKYELFIRRVCQNNHGSKACHFVPWMCPCLIVLGKTRIRSAQDGIYETLLLCSDLWNAKKKYVNIILKIWNFENFSSILTGNRFVTSCTQRASLSMIMCLAIWQSLMIEKGASLKLLSAILQNK